MAGSQSPAPVLNTALITFGTVLATFMYALDTTIANVAMPHMQGSFAAGQDQITWVLTSYIVASAIMTPPTGWLSNRFGRRRLFLISIAGFAGASVLCGIASSLEQMVIFRVLQGMFGAALVPMSQSILLDSYPREKHGSAMAIWGMGSVVGPVLGPTLGGWLTDNYSWRWVFYINIPFGLLAFLVVSAAVPESKINRKLRFDTFGFAALSIALAALQMLLDRGEQLDWFGSTEIVIEAVLSGLFFYIFLVHIFTAERPFISPRLFVDRNFSIGLVFITAVGVVLYGTLALLPPLLQNLLGYPVFTAGLLMAPRGVGTMIAMFVVGRLVTKYDPRYLVLFGLALSAYSLWWIQGFSLNVPDWEIAGSGLIQGFGLGFVFVPLTTLTFATLATEWRNEGTGLYNLMRNIGSSIGISAVITLLTQNTQIMHAALAEHVTLFNRLFDAPVLQRFWNLQTPTGVAVLNAEVTRQASMVAYINDFKMMMILTLLLIPLTLMISPPRKAAAAGTAPVIVD
jgi:DHA2 family multidrug resistance protein